MISVGELTDRKNQIVVLKALALIKSDHPELFSRLRYIMVGVGPNHDAYEKFIESHGLEKNVRMIGYRIDIPELLHASDLFVFPSHQEGLPVALMEALSSGINVICSKIRGNTDLVSEGLFEVDDVIGLEKKIVCSAGVDHRSIVGMQKRIQDFSIDVVEADMKRLFQIMD